MRLLQWSIACVIAAAAGVAYGQTSSFASIFRSPQCSALRCIGYESADTMYAAGDGAAFVRTTDGGATFSVSSISPGNEPVFALAFLNGSVGFAAGDLGLVAVTMDGGATWTDGRLPNPERVTGCYFDPVSRRGFAVTTGARIYATTDEGASWQLAVDTNVSSPGGFLNPFSAAAHLGGGTSIAVASGSVISLIFKTYDGGDTWTKLSTVSLPNATSAYFTDSLYGWIVATNSRNCAYTTNGGNSWNLGSYGNATVNAHSVFFTDEKNGWALETQVESGGILASNLWASTDGGKSFTMNKNKAGNNIVAMYAVRFDASGGNGWAVGDAGEIRKSTDGGATWLDVTSGVATGAVEAISFYDGNTGMVPVQNNSGVIYTTTDGGATWPVKLAKGTGENAEYALTMTSPKRAVALGLASGVYTTNGGASWSGCSGVNNNYRRVFGVDSLTLYACGDGGVVSKSTNGGASWTPVSTGNGNVLRGIYFFDAAHGFVCGDGGSLYETNDGGAHWTPFIGSFTTGYYDIYFNTPQSGWIATDSSGAVLHSGDGGTTWTPVAVSAAAHDTLDRIAFAGADSGWIAGSYGQLYQTTDGGTTWAALNTGTSNRIADMAAAPRQSPAALWLAGANGMVLKYSLLPVAVAEPRTAPLAFALGLSYPNPVRAGVAAAVPFSLGARSQARMEVYNALGARVRTLLDEPMAPGAYAVSWDGRDAAGRAVPPGAYFFSLRAGAARAVRAVVVEK